MRILFVVCGEGLGHASRSTKLAKYLQKQGHTCLFAAYAKGYSFIKKQGDFELFETCREVTLEGDGGYFDLAKTVSSSIGIPKALLKSFFGIRKILKNKNIDVLICDTMFAAGVAAKTLGIPVFFITNQNHFSSLAFPDAVYWKLFGAVIGRYLVTIPKAVLVPDFAEPNTVSEFNFDIKEKHKNKFRFIGPILDDDIKSHQTSRESVFASFGGEPFKMPMYAMLKEIAEEKKDILFEVFSTSPGLPKESSNFKTSEYIQSLYPHMAKASVTILHGGLTTLHESLYFNKPVIMIIDPYHPEQGNNGLKIEKMSAGIMIRGDTITKEILSGAIDRALEMKPVSLTHLFEEQNGCINACRIIEETQK
ncbi:MAG: glycosyltransferase family protein [Methanocorpusculum sp.]|nr:glycosyltransferase family protein [Methanocorpusculum sp.]